MTGSSTNVTSGSCEEAVAAEPELNTLRSSTNLTRNRLCCGPGCNRVVHTNPDYGGWCCRLCYRVNVWNEGKTCARGLRHGNSCENRTPDSKTLPYVHWELAQARPVDFRSKQLNSQLGEYEQPHPELRRRALAFYFEADGNAELVRRPFSFLLGSADAEYIV